MNATTLLLFGLFFQTTLAVYALLKWRTSEQYLKDCHRRLGMLIEDGRRKTARINELEAEVGALRSIHSVEDQIISNLTEVLRSIEWRGSNTAHLCPVCRESPIKGHGWGCDLAEALNLPREVPCSPRGAQ